MSVGFRFEIESPVFLWCVTRLSHGGSVRWTAKIVLAYCKRQCLGHTDCVVLLTHKVIKKARIGNYNAMIVGTVNGRKCYPWKLTFVLRFLVTLNSLAFLYIVQMPERVAKKRVVERI